MSNQALASAYVSKSPQFFVFPGFGGAADVVVVGATVVVVVVVVVGAGPPGSDSHGSPSLSLSSPATSP